MDDVVIRLENVSKFYKLYNSPSDRLKEALNPFGKNYHKNFYALKNLNLEIKKGEILGIVGKNGCGKSTLLKLISKVLTPSEGSLSVKGKISALLELGSGFNPEFTGLQNVFFYGSVLGFSREEMEAKLDDILEFAEIGDFIHQPLKTYSSGMKSRLGFAVAVHIEPDILILDEVLSVGDALFQRKCYAKMEEFFKGGKTIIYVSHSVDSINELCTRAILIDSGHLVMDASAKKVTTYYQKTLFSSDKLVLNNEGAVDSLNFGKDNEQNNEENENEGFYIPNLTSKSVMEYKNTDVKIQKVRILDDDSQPVNLLKFNCFYTLSAEIEFGVTAEKVAFGFEIKDERGVRLATVESAKMYKNSYHYSVREGDRYILNYKFKCLFTTGMYYMNLGVSSFDGEQKVLNRIVDVLVFKTINNQGYSGGYLDLVECLEVNTGNSVELIEIL